MRIAVFPGTFDPITLGHVDVIKRSIPLFDKIVIGIGLNSTKQPMFSIEQRMQWIQEIFKDTPSVSVAAYEGLTIEFCKKIEAAFILRGIRYVSDFEYEKGIADMNRMLSHHVETVFLTSSPQYSTVSSTLVRDVIRHHGDVSQFLPNEVQWDK
ncbi:pantetheine-phosphate adenylyltransferase [Taibaiella sp. KBW10]|uniref:pantetheine-phosphate adenylyltransferase n=1 Tax=Taibaiella sp. KBW10 TaxID=2153357 RepID=UPI000F598B26|nr:pantetheine-phosphate adenylyltransferase [Taibaiella sp. KBW10]RQO32460.1 pantetheine-phosphate adenylyltransferase [Taibaiella sp. KBW10]